MCTVMLACTCTVTPAHTFTVMLAWGYVCGYACFHTHYLRPGYYADWTGVHSLRTWPLCWVWGLNGYAVVGACIPHLALVSVMGGQLLYRRGCAHCVLGLYAGHGGSTVIQMWLAHLPVMGGSMVIQKWLAHIPVIGGGSMVMHTFIHTTRTARPLFTFACYMPISIHTTWDWGIMQMWVQALRNQLL